MRKNKMFSKKEYELYRKITKEQENKISEKYRYYKQLGYNPDKSSTYAIRDIVE